MFYSLLVEAVLRVEHREHLLVEDAEETVHHFIKVFVASSVVPKIKHDIVLNKKRSRQREPNVKTARSPLFVTLGVWR